MYYIDDSYDSDQIVLKFIDELLRVKYKDISWYCHNLGGYDIIFITKILLNYNENVNNKYKISFN